MERALYLAPIFVLTLAYTESERRFADCYAPVPALESPNKHLQDQPAGGAVAVRVTKCHEIG